MTKANHKLLFLSVLLLMTLCLASVGIIFNTTYAYASPAVIEKTVKIAHITDTHIFIEDYCNPLSKNYLQTFNSDTKMLEESTATIQAGLDLIFEEKVDYLMVTGDLTSNAEAEGHRTFAAMLTDLTQKMRAVEGYSHFQAFVTTGNHDLYNSRAANYMPSQEQLDACADDAARQALLENFQEKVEVATLEKFFEIYQDFGYGGVNCLGDIEFFFDSEFWYDSDAPLVTKKPSDTIIKNFKDSVDDYSILAPYSRLGALSYIVRLPDFTLINFDSSTRTYEGDKGAVNGWEHKTGGYITDDMLKWAINSTRADVANNRLVISMVHQNYLPHFDMEDEILKDFTLFNWEKVTYTLADNQIKYGFTGHMHSNDITNYVTQNGNVFYDIQTGSPVSCSSPVRILTFETKLEGENYTENLYSTMMSSDSSIDYFVPVYNFDSGLIEYEERHVDNILDHLDSLTNDMIFRLAEGYLNEDKIFTSLKDALKGIQNISFFNNTLYNLAIKIIDDLRVLNVYAPIFTNGYEADSTFTFTATPRDNYNLFNLIDDMVHWFINQDVTFGRADSPYTLQDAVSEIYRNHMSGADTNTLSTNLSYLYELANSGELINFLVDSIITFLYPQLDLITQAPIRLKATDPALNVGEGFDIATEYEALSNVRLVGNLVSSLFDDNLLKVVNNVLNKATTLLNNATISSLLNNMGAMDSLNKIMDVAFEFLGNFEDYDSITKFIDAEILDKYYTDALSTNLGIYVGQIIKTWAVDYTEDGSYIDETITDRLWNIKHIPNFHVRYSEAAFAGNSYQKVASPAALNGIKVIPTISNGLLPSMLSVTLGEDTATSKEFKWYTKIQVDIYNKDSVPQSFIKYWTKGKEVNATYVKAESSNVTREIPLIDLGITYLTKALHTFNMHTVSLTDLAPNTEYYYVVGSDSYGWSDTYTFRTGDADGAFTILALTDIQGSVEKNYLDSLEDIKTALDFVKNPAFILSAGDNVDKGKSTYQWQWLLDGQREVWGNNTLMTLSGNHENDTSIIDFLALIPNAKKTDVGPYYSFDYSNTHFVVLNTNDLSEEGISDTQLAWLKADLEANNDNPDTKWTIVALHKGMYTVGSHAFDADVITLRSQLTSVFVEYGVNLVLQGHDHTYSLTEYIGADGKPVKVTYDDRGAAINPTGIPYINLGTIGDKFYNYIYHEDVPLMARSSSTYKNTPLAQYFVNGKLELTETPVFAKLDIDNNNLSIITYTIVEGKIIQLDKVMISDTAVYCNCKSLSGGAIAGIVIGSVAGAGGLGFAIFWLLVRRKKMVA